MGIEFQQYDDGSRRLVDDATGNIVAYADPTSRVMVIKTASVARTDTSAKNLYTLPANAQVIRFEIMSAAVSDAGTTATLSVGKTGSNTFFINAQNVKTTPAANTPTAAVSSNLFTSVGSSAIQVVGIYAETGTASTTGGPWNVTCHYFVPNP